MIIKHKYTTLNEFIKLTRTDKYLSARCKKQETSFTYYHFRDIVIPTPCKLIFTWYVKNKRTDPDNLAFAKKFILDGAMQAGAIPNDSLKHITGFEDKFEIADYYGVKIEWEVNDG